MSSRTLTGAAAPDTRPARATAPRRAILALARVEAVRLLRHPLTGAAILLMFGFWISALFTNQSNQYPVLQDLDRDSELGMMLLLGGAALIASNLATLRAHRHGTTGLGDVLILPDHARTVAHLLALLPLAALAAVLVAIRVGVLALATSAAGRPDPYELATGPATVLLLGALGVLLGRLTRSAIAAPLALLALLASLIVLPLLASGGSAQWLQPVVGQGDPVLPLPAPVYLMARPAGAHLGYLLGLAGLLAVAALLRTGARTRRVALAGVAALAVTVAGCAVQLMPPSPTITAARAAAMNHPAGHQTCRPLDHVTYCAFAGFTPWIPAWNTIVQAVLTRVPATAGRPPLTIRQRIVVLGAHGEVSDGVPAAWRADDAAAGTPGAVSVDTRWGDSRSAATLAALVAYRLAVAAGPGPEATACGGLGALVVWLAGQASPQASTGLRKLVADQQDGVTFAQAQTFPGIHIGQPGLSVGLAALDRPASDIATRVRSSWAALTAPGTSAAQAAALLGVPAPGPAAPSGRCP